MSAIVIRKTTIADIDQTVRLGNKVWRAAYAHIMSPEVFDARDAKADEKIKQAKEIGVNMSGRIDYVAVDGNKVVAFAIGTTESGYENYKGHADLMAIYINPEYQRFGLGRKLFDKVVAFFKKEGCKMMVIGVLKENTQARKAYEKWGGKLDAYETQWKEKVTGLSFPEVFYTYNLTRERK
jgi:ribosomal protein S18 acetylase RimI-like enzyme